MDKLKRQLIAWLISKLLGDDSKFIIISIKKKELHKLIHNKSSSLDVHHYDIPQFASKEIILNINFYFIFLRSCILKNYNAELFID